MQITNKYGVPSIVIEAIKRRNDAYDKGEVDRSVTQLINSPRIDLLRKRNYPDIEVDASQEFWALLGSAVHSILELGAGENHVVEERLFAELDGWRLSGAIDVQEYRETGIAISDYKVTTLFSFKMASDGIHHEWTAQQNIYRWLVETVKKIPVEELWIIAILRDWSTSAAKRDPLYPPSPIVPVPIELWSMEQTESFIRERINSHRTAEMSMDLTNSLPECSAHDRWERGSQYKIKRIGGKRAIASFPTEALALERLDSLPADHIMEFVEGESIRCEGNFCRVRDFCDQYARMKRGNDEQ